MPIVVSEYTRPDGGFYNSVRKEFGSGTIDVHILDPIPTSPSVRGGWRHGRASWAEKRTIVDTSDFAPTLVILRDDAPKEKAEHVRSIMQAFIDDKRRERRESRTQQ